MKQTIEIYEILDNSKNLKGHLGHAALSAYHLHEVLTNAVLQSVWFLKMFL